MALENLIVLQQISCCHEGHRDVRRSPDAPALEAKAPAQRPLDALSWRKGWNNPIAFDPPPTAAARARSSLLAGFIADYRLKVAHQLQVGMGTGGRAIR